jgi:hypothetical protein
MTQATLAWRLWISVPCKGRLSFLRRTAPALLAQPDLGYCLVDFDCPDHCGDWLERTFPADLAAGRVLIERITQRPFFHKAAAHNAGARRIAAAGGEHVAFLDADVSGRPGFALWLAERLACDRFWIAGLADDGWEHPGLVGFVALSMAAFVESGGFDEQFRDWGAEDLEFRVRLLLERELEFGEVPVELFDCLPHGDDLRVQHYEEKDMARSHLRNLTYFARKLRRRGQSFATLDERTHRLMRRVRGIFR